MVAMAMYSPRRNSRNGVEEYSTMKPATSSDSASTRSKGGRLVSASAEMKNMTNIGKSASQCQSSSEFVIPRRVPMPDFCASTMAAILSDPTHSSTETITKPIDTSCDTVGAAALRLPMNGYLELEAQPPMMMP